MIGMLCKPFVDLGALCTCRVMLGLVLAVVTTVQPTSRSAMPAGFGILAGLALLLHGTFRQLSGEMAACLHLFS